MANTVDKVIDIAEKEVGYLEKSALAYKKDKTVLDRKTDGSGYDNYTKYGRDMHNIYPSVMDFPAAWCDCFVDWCFYKAYGVTTAKSLLGGNFDDYTVASAQMYKNKGAWHTKNPRIGDQIFFKNSTRICHTGLVYGVSGGRVYTIEGNTSNASGVIANGGCVAKKSYLLSYSKIAGYGRPKYDGASTEPAKPEKNIPQLANSSPNLRKGRKNAQVGYLQQCLNYLRFNGKDGKALAVDNDFGSNTDYALRAFQKTNGLVADGIYGSKSRKKMKELLK